MRVILIIQQYVSNVFKPGLTCFCKRRRNHGFKSAAVGTVRERIKIFTRQHFMLVDMKQSGGQKLLPFHYVKGL